MRTLHSINLISPNNPNATVVVAGDFNLGNVDWEGGILQVSLEQGDSMPFWSYIRAKIQDNSGVSPFLKQGVLHMDNLSKAKILND